MKQHYLLIIFLSFSISCFAQQNKRLTLEINYGLNGNFFVRSYNENAGLNSKSFYNKNFLGSIAGIEIKCKVNPRSALGVAYAKSVNSKEIDYKGQINGVNVGIINFNIRHTNKFYQFYYDRSFSKKIPGFFYQIGLLYLRMNQQEVDLTNINNSILFEERNYKSYKLEEGGIFFGLHYTKKIDTKFDLGIKSRIYYLISTSSLEAITLTPSLSYHF